MTTGTANDTKTNGPADSPSLLTDAYDLHIHCGPDMVDRCVTGYQAAVQARDRGMAGIGIKDHCCDTGPAAAAILEALGGSVAVFGWLVLNPPVGGFNPTAVQAALRKGTRIVCFPTYSARNSLLNSKSKVTSKYPLPEPFSGYTVLDESGGIPPDVAAILGLIAEADAVLATGHLAAEESFRLLEAAREAGVRRMLANHVSSNSISMSPDLQRKAAGLGAFLEHSALSVDSEGKEGISISALAESIRAVGIDHVILSSDLGRTGREPPADGFGDFLTALTEGGFSSDEIRVMVHENPSRLLY